MRSTRRQDPRRGGWRCGRGSRCSTSSSRSSSSSCSRSTTTRAASTSRGRASRSSHWADPFANPDLAVALKNSLLIALVLDAARDRARDVHGARARALRLPRPQRRRPARLPPARDPGGRARRRAARAVPDDGGQHRLRDDRDRPHDVHDLLRGGDGEGAAGGHGPPHRGGGDGPRGDRVDDVPQDHAADDRARRRGGGAAGVRDLDRRLRDHELQRRPDPDVPALHLRRHAPGRAARGQRAGHRAARGRADPDGAQRDAAAAPGGALAAPRDGSTSPRRRRSCPPVASRRTGLVFDERCFGHHNPPGGPPWLAVPPFERPERLAATFRALEGSGVLRHVERLPAASAPRTALELVHDASHVERVLAEPRATTRARPRGVDRAGQRHRRAARGRRDARGGRVRGGRRDRTTRSCSRRPPGHHAEAARPMGFCLFNATAVAARWAQLARGAARVAILDWDVHHGNGTEAIFRDDAHRADDLAAPGRAVSERHGRGRHARRGDRQRPAARRAPATRATRWPSSASSSPRSAPSPPTCC